MKWMRNKRDGRQKKTGCVNANFSLRWPIRCAMARCAIRRIEAIYDVVAAVCSELTSRLFDIVVIGIILYGTGISRQVTSPVHDGLKIPMELTLRTGENSQLIVSLRSKHGHESCYYE